MTVNTCTRHDDKYYIVKCGESAAMHKQLIIAKIKAVWRCVKTWLET